MENEAINVETPRISLGVEDLHEKPQSEKGTAIHVGKLDSLADDGNSSFEMPSDSYGEIFPDVPGKDDTQRSKTDSEAIQAMVSNGDQLDDQDSMRSSLFSEISAAERHEKFIEDK